MATITVNPISRTTCHLRMQLAATGQVLSMATGFFYERGGGIFLITNWHNVSGRHPSTGECLSDHLGTPDEYSTIFRRPDNPLQRYKVELPLYLDSQQQQPRWFEHPVHGRNVDVVALRLPPDVASTYILKPINNLDFETSIQAEVADDSFVVGYPFAEKTDLDLPIWKRASIASEPGVDIDGLPKLLIDTATRPGLSGSPVVMKRVGIHGMTEQGPVDSTILGEVKIFLGVYSGRVGADEVRAQLGIVWKARVIDEIIDAQVIGSPP
jgi:hypothetical protein